MKHFLNILSFILPLLTIAQVEEDFSDGNFTSNPVWSGTAADFTVNPNFQLQTSASIAGTSYLSTPHSFTDLNNKEWNFYVKQSFAGSTSNFGRIYLAADNANLSSNPNGYYLQLGESLTTDAIRLCKYDNGLTLEICSGTAGAIATSTNAGIRVVRDANGTWSLYVDYAGGTNFVFQSTGTLQETFTGTHMGFLCTYTASNATKFYFDDIYAGDEILDIDAPVLLSATAVNATNVDLLFSEAIEQASAETLENYEVTPTNPVVLASRDATNPALIHLILENPIGNGILNEITVTNVADLSGNTSVQTAGFTFMESETPEKGDVLINEFMCDPSPVVGLPELEYVEIYNRSNKFFNLNAWKLGDNATFGTLANAWLAPGEYKILCATSSVDSFPGAVAVTSFPSLNNSSDDIVLKDNNGFVLDQLTYSASWYQDAVKEAGGHSLEKINPNHPCSGASNWRASNHPDGGTPGLQNSIFDNAPDIQAPQLTYALASGPNLLTVQFNEGLDSTSVMNAALSTVPVLTIANVILENPFSSTVKYEFQENLLSSQIYHFTLTDIADCWLNATDISGQFIRPDSVEAGDLAINEILFNPITGGSDFVEIRNNSNKVLDLYQLSLANIDDGEIANFSQVPVHFMLKHGELAVLTQDSTVQKQTYPAAVPGRFIQMSLPSFNNDSSTVCLMKELDVLDKVGYSEKWHFRLLDDFDGKSLEKIDPEGKSNDPGNWHTAAEAVGFATPGRENSQYSAATQTGNFSFTSETFSPDNDGNEDVLQINYEMDKPGMVASVNIYDDRGRLVRNLVRSELISSKGSLTWDGISDNNQKAAIGTYILLFEAFNASGDLFTQKRAFVLAGRLN